LIYFYFLSSKWGSNIFFKGSYTHIPLGADSEDFKSLAEPIPGPEVINYVPVAIAY